MHAFSLRHTQHTHTSSPYQWKCISLLLGSLDRLELINFSSILSWCTLCCVTICRLSIISQATNRGMKQNQKKKSMHGQFWLTFRQPAPDQTWKEVSILVWFVISVKMTSMRTSNDKWTFVLCMYWIFIARADIFCVYLDMTSYAHRTVVTHYA